MSENINLNNLSQFLGPQQVQEGQETQQTSRTIGQSQTDTVGQQEQFVETNVPQSVSSPLLQDPNYSLTQQGQAPEQQAQDPATQERNVRSALEQDPEVGEQISTFLNRRDRNTAQGREQLVNDIVRYLQQKGENATPANIRQAVANEVRRELNNAPPDQAQDLLNELNDLRTGIFGDSNPSFGNLVEELAQTYVANGETPENAQRLAQADVLNTIDRVYGQNNVQTPAIAPGNLLSTALTVAYFEQLNTVFDPSLSAGFAAGITGGTDVFNNFLNWVNGINEAAVGQAQGASEAQATQNVQAAITTANGAVDTLEQILNGTLALQSNFENANRVSVEEFLQVLAETISLVQEILRELQIADARRSQQLSRTEALASGERRDARLRAIEKQLAALSKQQKNAKLFKALGITIAILAAPLAALLLPTGAGIVAFIAIISISLAISATFIALQETGVTDKVFSKITEGLEDLAGQLGIPESGRKIFAALVLVLVIVAIVAVAAAAGGAVGGLAGSVGGSVAREISTQTAKSAATIVGTQVATAAVTNSNVIGTFVEGVVRAQAGDELSPEEEQAIAIVTAILTILTVLIISAAGAGAAKSIGSSAAKQLDAAQDAGRISTEAVERSSQTVPQFLPKLSAGLSAGGSILTASSNIEQAVNRIQIAKLRVEEARAQAVAEQIDQLISDIQQEIRGFQQDAENYAQLASQLTDLFFTAVSGLSSVIQGLSSANQA